MPAFTRADRSVGPAALAHGEGGADDLLRVDGRDVLAGDRAGTRILTIMLGQARDSRRYAIYLTNKLLALHADGDGSVGRGCHQTTALDSRRLLAETVRR
jgi:hypothetical protein